MSSCDYSKNNNFLYKEIKRFSMFPWSSRLKLLLMKKFVFMCLTCWQNTDTCNEVESRFFFYFWSWERTIQSVYSSINAYFFIVRVPLSKFTLLSKKKKVEGLDLSLFASTIEFFFVIQIYATLDTNALVNLKSHFCFVFVKILNTHNLWSSRIYTL